MDPDIPQTSPPKTEPQRTSKKRWLILRGFLVLLVIFGGVLVMLTRSRNNKQTAPSSVQTQAAGCVKETSNLTPAQVSITKDGFVPADIEVSRCQQVTWTNTDSAAHEVAADPYPSHTTYPELVSPELAKNESFTLVPEKTGTFTYHDELNPSKFQATITVK